MQAEMNLEKGIELRDQGIAQVAENNAAFLKLMRAFAEQISMRNGEVSSDEVRLRAQAEGYAPKHSNAWGALFKAPGWKFLYRKKSVLPSNHGREIRVWKYVGVRNGKV